MMKRIFISILQIFIFINCSCQNNLSYKILSNNKYIDIYDNHVRHFTIEYKNESTEIILIWVDFAEEKSIDTYFRVQKGDFNLSFLIYENLLTSSNMQIGSSFMKVMAPLETFKFQIGLKYIGGAEKELNKFQACIQSAPLDIILNKFKFHTKTFPSYIGNEILINL